MSQYNAEYYQTMDGKNPYTWESPVWRKFFGSVAEEIVRHFNPASSIDIGCAIGLLVHELRRRGVDAYGVDGSAYAVGEAHRNGLTCVSIGDITLETYKRGEGVEFVSCIEVVEHIDPLLADIAIFNLCASTGWDNVPILFSSSPDDLTEPTHVNVQPEDYWLALFAKQGFRKVESAPWVSKQAMILRCK